VKRAVVFCFCCLFLFSPAWGAQNIVPNGNFEQADSSGKSPAGWQPLRRGYEWIQTNAAHGRIMRFFIPREIARGEGFRFFSNAFRIKDRQPYHFHAQIRSAGPEVTIFINGYGTQDGIRKRVFRRQIDSEDRPEINDWISLDFNFIPAQGRVRARMVNPRNAVTRVKVTEMDIEVFVHGSEGGVLELDNVTITPGATSSRPASHSVSEPTSSTLHSH